MNARTQRAQRMQKVQAQLHRIDEYKMADLERQKAELEQDQQALIAALNSDGALRGLFADAIARRLSRLGQEAGQIGLEMEAQTLKLLEQTVRVICAERLAGKRLDEERSDQERQLLLDAIEFFVARTP
jgi:hypothetical protein